MMMKMMNGMDNCRCILVLIYERIRCVCVCTVCIVAGDEIGAEA